MARFIRWSDSGHRERAEELAGGADVFAEGACTPAEGRPAAEADVRTRPLSPDHA